MEIVAYTLVGCSHCSSLKELFRRAETEYNEVMVNRDMTVQEFREKYPGVVNFPYVVIDDAPVGGLVESVKLFVEKGLVSRSKKKE